MLLNRGVGFSVTCDVLMNSSVVDYRVNIVKFENFSLILYEDMLNISNYKLHIQEASTMWRGV